MEQDEKRITDLINKLMESDNLEKAPEGFTHSVMTEVEKFSKSPSIAYKPLIPKYVWWLIILFFLGSITYFNLNRSNTNNDSQFFVLPEFSFRLFDTSILDFSAGLMYAMVFLVIMICVQVPLVKQYYDKRLAV
ncbi:hypothetical protein [Winogradskyella alexanderae]|uniref:Uncharacterized protein n=1 Tax=Winogradskyella alexanderae TaxID=2877123 RepID=A0ABS7XPX0_9FLAO|nr:hypothetical protein [Winogradskyella alexanderae]MCA0132062.1 hypothetical protein [Winogradskyella alexanderae]